MIKKILVLVGLSTIVIGCATTTKEPRNERTKEPQPKVSVPQSETEKLIRQLGDDDWEIREKAQKELIEKGKNYKPTLIKILNQTTDPEIKSRLTIILNELFDLSDDLARCGIMFASTAKLIFVGSEADVGSDIRVTIIDPDIIKTVWDSIEQSKPTTRWALSGYRTIEFYNSVDSITPLAKLKVNETNASFVDGSDKHYYDKSKEVMFGMFKCDGLEELVMKYLKKEYNKVHPKQNDQGENK